MKGKIILSAILSTMPLLSLGASFDCAKASTSVEKMICEDSELSKFDEELGSLYKKVKEIAPEEKKKQKAWISERNQCDSVNCLSNLYMQRNLDIQTVIESSEAQTDDSAVSPASAQPTDMASNPTVLQEPTPVTTAPPESQLSAPVESTKEKGSSSQRTQSDLWGIGLLILGILGASVLLGIFFGIKSRCPNCKKWFVEKTTGQELVNRRKGSKTVKRQDIHKDRDGRIIKTVERQEQIQVTLSKYKVFHQCIKCGHEWVTTKTDETE